MPSVESSETFTQRGALMRSPLRLTSLWLLAVLAAACFAWVVPSILRMGERVELMQEVPLLREPTPAEISRINKLVARESDGSTCKKESRHLLSCSVTLRSSDVSDFAGKYSIFIESINLSLTSEGLISEKVHGGLSRRSSFLGTGLSVSVVTGLVLIAFSCLLICISRRILGQDVRQGPVGGRSAAMAAALALLPLLWATAAVFPSFSVEKAQQLVNTSSIALILVVVAGEELLFRSWMVGVLGSRLGAATAIGMSAVLFSFCHDFSHPMAYLVAIFFGLCLGVYYHVRRSLVVCIIVHAAYNAVLAIR